MINIFSLALLFIFVAMLAAGAMLMRALSESWSEPRTQHEPRCRSCGVPGLPTNAGIPSVIPLPHVCTACGEPWTCKVCGETWTSYGAH